MSGKCACAAFLEACSTDNDCCNQGFCVKDAGSQIGRCWCFETIGSGDVCSGPPIKPQPPGGGPRDAGPETPGGPPPPGTFRIIGYPTTPKSIIATPRYTHVIPSGDPIGVTSLGFVHYVTTAPNASRAYDVLTPGTLALNDPLLREPLAFDTTSFGSVGGTTFEMIVGEELRATWYRYNLGARTEINLPLPTTPGSTTIRAVAVGFHPLAAAAVHETVIATVSPAWVFHYSMKPTPLLLKSRPLADTSANGVRSMNIGEHDVWLVGEMPNRFIRIGLPGLSTISAHDLPSEPLAVDGGQLLAGGVSADGGVPSPSAAYVVVLLAAGSTAPAQIRAYREGNTDGSKSIGLNLPPGTPVAMHVSAIDVGEFAWVAMRDPNRLLMYSVAGTGIRLLAELPLPGQPVEFSLGGGAGVEDAGASAGPLVHIVLR